jgi:transposase
VLELIPAQFKVIVYERAKYACRRCEEQRVVIAPVPAKPIDGGLVKFRP